MKKYIVTVEFADKNNISKHFKPGDELPAEFEADRLANIVKLGLAKVEDTEGGNVTDIDLTGKAADIAAQVKVLPYTYSNAENHKTKFLSPISSDKQAHSFHCNRSYRIGFNRIKICV